MDTGGYLKCIIKLKNRLYDYEKGYGIGSSLNISPY